MLPIQLARTFIEVGIVGMDTLQSTVREEFPLNLILTQPSEGAGEEDLIALSDPNRSELRKTTSDEGRPGDPIDFEVDQLREPTVDEGRLSRRTDRDDSTIKSFICVAPIIFIDLDDGAGRVGQIT